MSTRIRAALATAAVGVVTALAPSFVAAAPIGPNYCLSGSTATECLVALDMLNTPEAGPPDLGMFVPGSISIVSSNRLNVTFEAGTVDGVTYNFGDIFLNVYNLGDVLGVQNISYLKADGSNPIQQPNYQVLAGGSYQADGWGTFNLKLDANDGFASSVKFLSFDVVWDTTVWTDLTTQQVLMLNGVGNTHGQNSNGQSAAGHVFLAINGDNTDISLFAAWPNCEDQGACTTTIDEPSPLALLGLGGLMLGIGMRRRVSR